MNNSRVRVGVRIRPLNQNEKGGSNENRVFDVRDNTSLVVKGQTFTYDHIFNANLSQTELYTQTAAPMLKSFLEGYNVTVIAYGQTGSGKTYTMGTSDLLAASQDQGLIPRFLTDLFDNIQSSVLDNGERLESTVSVSFLEIYGEDVYDLINNNTAPSSNNNKQVSDRPSLMVREDDKGHAIVQGLLEVNISSAESALEQLDNGTRNRITGKTNMNAGSSRSHAVFSVKLKQTIRSGQSDDVQHMTSILTFVDLAGSERIKRTGAEGQRLKEGIQINSGLFNLGQVINALADEQRLKQGAKAVHVPYRNSKLTHLLKDALGGNSQTLFLACVSPAEVNESETLSTLNYAKQARNIQNKPVQNMDQVEQELRRLKASNKAWMLRCVYALFSSKPHGLFIEHEAVSMMQRPEVQAYLAAVEVDFGSKLEIIRPSPCKVRLSLAPHRIVPGRTSLPSSYAQEEMIRPSNLGMDLGLGSVDESEGEYNGSDDEGEEGTSSTTALLGAVDPEETERLLSRMMDMVSKEKGKHATSDDNAYDGDDNDDGISDDNVDQAIEEKEQILQQLMVTVKGYSTLKSEYERLLETIGSLEKERKELEVELEKAKHSVDSIATIESMKTRYATIAAELESMRRERKKKEVAYVKMQRESKQCEALRKELLKLKESKVALQRQQKTQVAALAKLKKEQQVRVLQLKKGDVKKQQQMNTLKGELSKKDNILHRRQCEITRITNKLHACEEHITQLLKMQNRNRNRTAGAVTVPSTFSTTSNSNQLSASDISYLQSAKSMLDSLVKDRLNVQQAKLQSEQKLRARQQISQKILVQAGILDNLRQHRSAMALELQAQGIDDDVIDQQLEVMDEEIVATEEIVDHFSNEIEMIDADLQELARDLDLTSSTTTSASASTSNWEDISKQVISSLSSGQIQQLTWELLSDKSSAQEMLLQLRDDIIIKARDLEVANDRVSSLSKQLAGVKSEMKDKQAAAQLRYSQDTWQLAKANNSTSSAENGSIVNQVAMQRAVELEEQLQDKQADVMQIQKQLNDAMKRAADLQQSITAMELEAGDNNTSSSGNDNFFQSIKSIWGELGLNEEQQDDAVRSLRQQTSSLRTQLIQDQQVYLDKLKAECESLQVDVGLFNEALGITSDINDIDSMGWVSRHQHLQESLSKQLNMFKEKMTVLSSLKERLLDYMLEMRLDSSSIPSTLQQLMRFPSYDDSDDETSYARAIVKVASRDGQDVRMSLGEDMMLSWERALRDLNMQRISYCDKIQHLRHHVLNLATVLDVQVDRDFILQVIRSAYASNNINSSDGFRSDDEECDAMMLIMIPASPPPGSSRIMEIMESMLLAMEDMMSSRRLLITYLDDIVRSLSSLLDIDDSASKSNNNDVDRLSPSSQNLTAILSRTHDLSSKIMDTNTSNRQHLYELLVELDKLISNIYADNRVSIDKKISDYESMVSDLPYAIDVTCIDDKYQAVYSMSLAAYDQQQYASTLEAIWSSWNSFVKPISHQATAILSEMRRIDVIVKSLREVHSVDLQLQQQVTIMEEFEVKSKQDRMKKLAGNSRALVEEEKFRKTSKRKYEHLTERLLAAASTLQTSITAKPMNNSSDRYVSIDVAVEFTGLSHQSQLLLRGTSAAKDTTSLMHLHTTTHGTRHWSGEVPVPAPASSHSAPRNHDDAGIENLTGNKANAIPVLSKEKGNPFSSIISASNKSSSGVSHK